MKNKIEKKSKICEIQMVDERQYQKLLFLNVNGKDVNVDCRTIDPEISLAFYLRETLALCGTKLGCEEGVCGSCTVVLGTWHENLQKAKYEAVNACLVPLFSVHKKFVITVEGIGNRQKIHPIQDRLAKGHALQCGFCSPGFVMSAYALLRNFAAPTIEQIDSAVKGNLCRCTGYRPILEALYSFSDQKTGGCCGGSQNGKCCKDTSSESDEYEKKLVSFSTFPKYDPTQEIIYPPSLRAFQDSKNPIIIKGNRVTVIIPKTLEQLLELRQRTSGIIKFISSGLITRLIGTNRAKHFNETWILLEYIPDFSMIQTSSDQNRRWISIGSALSISHFVDILKNHLDSSIFNEMNPLFTNYSSPQVSNFATWAGNIIMGCRSAQSVSDYLIVFLALNWRLTIVRDNSNEFEQISAQQFVEQRLFNGSTIVVNALIDLEEEKIQNRRLFSLKLGESNYNDSTIFNIFALIDFSSFENSRILIGTGGIPKRFQSIEEAFFNDENIWRENIDLHKIIEPLDLSSKHKSHLKAALSKLLEPIHSPIEHRINYLQFFKPNQNQSVGRPLANYYNERAITGEALFVTDIKSHNALHLGFVLSTVAHAEIESIDASEALKLDGVVDYFDVSDVIGNNTPGMSEVNLSFPDDTPVFADQKVESIGQIIGVIVGTDVIVARRAAKLVQINYKNLPALIDFEDAIERNSLLGEVKHFGKSEVEVEEAIKASPKIIEGQISIGGQEHFYLEPQSCLSVPGEGDEIVMHCSTQAPSFCQLMVAKFLALPAHKIIVKTKRLGGAFGGKVSSPAWIACISALVSQKLKRPVYGCLSRQEDLLITGKRHPVLAKYRAGISETGRLLAIHHKVWLNGGWSKDHTEAITMVIGLKIDDVYSVDACRFDGYPVKTNTSSNTAFRGYGNPQMKLINEGVMRRIASECQTSVEEIKKSNFLREGQRNFLGGMVHSDALIECWTNCEEISEFRRRSIEIDVFNESSEYKKRAIAMSSVRYGLPLPGPSHGIASVLINLDGSIQLTIGGTEMGQGLNQKMLQVCSEQLNRPINTITIVDTSTDKVTNAPETGGSQNADTNGLAVMACCRRLLDGLQPYLKKNQNDWLKAIRDAFHATVPLQCTEYGRPNRQEFGVEDSDSPYNTTGACAIEVEVDCLTGFNKILRVDLVMDVGQSLNPAIDIGQIEGAFMQAYGFVTCEHISYDPKSGKLEQSSAGKYKIPTSSMVPRDFRVKLLGVDKTKGAQVYSSKGIGEPPMMMCTGAINSAILKAVEVWRKAHGITEFVETVSPLNAAKILELCSF